MTIESLILFMISEGKSHNPIMRTVMTSKSLICQQAIFRIGRRHL